MKVDISRLRALVRFTLFGLLSMTILAAGVWAQIGTQATFVGAVKDSSGAIVAGATVTATNIATGESQSAPTNQDGLYRIPQLPPGHYRLQSTQTGFRAEVHGDIELTVGQTQEVDFTLQVGANTETVTVTGEAPLVDTSTSTVSSLVNEQQVQDLPLNGRDFSQLLYLTPGVSNSSAGFSGIRGNQEFEIAGTRATASRYMVDGSELSGTGIGTNHLPNTPSSKFLGVDAIAEFAVVDSNGDASIGKDEGGQINIVTRSGTNDLHGTAYEFFRSKAFDAANYFSPVILPLTRNNFGGSIGGPIRKNKTFFFFNYEESKDNEGQAFLPTVPTPSVRGIGTPNGVEQIPTGQILNGVCQIASISPTTGTQTLNEVVPGFSAGSPANLAAVKASNSILNFFQANISAAAYNAGIPLTANGCPTGTQLVSLGLPLTFTDKFIMGRIDHQVTEKQSIFGRYLIDTGARELAQNDPLNITVEYNVLRTQLFTFGHRYAFSSGLLNQFTVSFNRGFFFIPGRLASGLDPSSIPSALALLPGGTPVVTQIGAVAIGSVGSQNATFSILPELDDNEPAEEFHDAARNVYEADEQLSKNVGRHFLQGGIQFQHIYINQNSASQPEGTVTFPNLLQFAQGIPSQFAGDLPCCANPARSSRQNYFATYVQDSYKIRSNLTLNFGLRWELMTEAVERHNLFVQWYPVLGGDGACAPTITCYPAFPAFANGGFPASFSEPGLVYPTANIFPINHSGNWAPRLGFAWNVFGSGKTSVRGGFGMFYEQIQTNPAQGTGVILAPYLDVVTLAVPSSLPSIPWPTPGSVLQSAAAGVVAPTGIVPNPPVPTMLQYNLTVQQQVAPQTTLSIGYVGNEGYHQNRAALANLPALVTNAAGRLAFSSMTVLTKGTTSTGSLQVFDANSDYNSLQTTLERRLSHGLQLKAIFVWNKGLDEAPDPYSPLQAIAPTGILGDPRYDRGRDPFDVGKSFTFIWIYDLPLGKHDKLTGLALNGWQFAGLYHQQSGIPFNVYDGVSQLFSVSNATSAFARPDFNTAFSGPIILSGAAEHPAPGVVQYFNPNAFVPAPYGVLGNAGEGTLSGPGLANVDVSLMKYFNFTERFKLQFRVDAFNLLNHPNFANPAPILFNNIVNTNPAIGATCNIGSSTNACSQTQYAVGDTSPLSETRSATAGTINTTATDNRELQFALKLIF